MSPTTAAKEHATYAVVRNVLDLMANDVIWPDALVTFDGGRVDVKPWRTWMLTQPELEKIRERVDRIESEFPGGEHKVQAGRASGGTRGRPFFDQATYRVNVLDVALTIEYRVPHTHSTYSGSVGRDGVPEWRCNGCRQRITVTAARKLGLLPPLVKGRKL